MVVRKGHEAEIVVERMPYLDEKGIMGEEIYAADQSLDSGDVLHTRLFPIVDDDGNETVATSDVTLYADGSPILESAELFSLGTDGRVFILTAAGELSGKAITIDYNYKRTIGYAQGVSWTVDTPLDPAHVIGQKSPKEIKAGAVDITGNVDEFFVDRNAFEQAANLVDGKLIEFDMTITDNPSASGPITTKFSNVRFGTWNYDMTDDGFTGNNVDFTAENINCSHG
jgi:hypothetical protein